jgi:hypothetical protein
MKQNSRKTVAIDNRQAAATRAYRDEMARRGVTLVAPSPFKASPKGARS